MLSKQIAGQSLPLLPPGHVPIRTFLCAIPAAFSHALFGGAGLVHWLSALQMGAELLFWQAKKGVVWGTARKSGQMVSTLCRELGFAELFSKGKRWRGAV